MVCGTYRYDLDLCRRTWLAAWRNGLRSVPARIFLYGILPPSFLFALWLAYCCHEYMLIILLALFIVWLFLLPLLQVWFFLPRRFRADPNADADITVCFSEEGMRQTTPATETRVTWNNFRMVRELPQHFMLVFHNGATLLIPQAAFADDGRVRALRALMRAHAPG